MKLELEQISKQFRVGEHRSAGVSDISFTVKDGEFIGICGASGCGKSTLFHLIAGILAPDSGMIAMDGISIQKQNAEWLARYRNETVGYIMQGYSLINHLTVQENLYLPIVWSKGKKNRTSQQRVSEVLKEVNMEGYENQYPGQLSGGEQNRIQIARALMNQPKLLLADEPTNGLDNENAWHIIELLKSIAQKGTAVIISTHQEEYLKDADRIYWIK